MNCKAQFLTVSLYFVAYYFQYLKFKVSIAEFYQLYVTTVTLVLFITLHVIGGFHLAEQNFKIEGTMLDG